MTISEVVRAARECNMTYGAYVSTLNEVPTPAKPLEYPQRFHRRVCYTMRCERCGIEHLRYRKPPKGTHVYCENCRDIVEKERDKKRLEKVRQKKKRLSDGNPDKRNTK